MLSSETARLTSNALNHRISCGRGVQNFFKKDFLWSRSTSGSKASNKNSRTQQCFDSITFGTTRGHLGAQIMSAMGDI